MSFTGSSRCVFSGWHSGNKSLPHLKSQGLCWIYRTYVTNHWRNTGLVCWMPAEPAVNVTWHVQVFTFCLSRSLQRHLAPCSEGAWGISQHCLCAWAFQSGGSSCLGLRQHCLPCTDPSDGALPATQRHQRTHKNWALPLDTNVLVLWAPLKASMLSIEKKFSLDTKEVVHQGKKCKQSTRLCCKTLCRKVLLFTSPLVDSSTD